VAAEYTYLGAEERIYSAYLTAAEDGTVSTLIGTPSMGPVPVLRAAGNEHLPEVPEDGLWANGDQQVLPQTPAAADAPSDAPTDAPPLDAPAAAVKPAKTVKVVTS